MFVPVWFSGGKIGQILRTQVKRKKYLFQTFDK